MYMYAPVGLDSSNRIVSEKMRKDAKKAYKEGERGKKMGKGGKLDVLRVHMGSAGPKGGLRGTCPPKRP